MRIYTVETTVNTDQWEARRETRGIREICKVVKETLTFNAFIFCRFVGHGNFKDNQGLCRDCLFDQRF